MLEAQLVSESDRVQKLLLSGEFNFFTKNKVEDILNSIEIEKIKTLIIDLSSISFIDSSAVGLLVAYHVKFYKLGIKILIITGENMHVMRRFNRILIQNEPELELFKDIKKAEDGQF